MISASFGIAGRMAGGVTSEESSFAVEWTFAVPPSWGGLTDWVVMVSGFALERGVLRLLDSGEGQTVVCIYLKLKLYKLAHFP